MGYEILWKKALTIFGSSKGFFSTVIRSFL